MKMPMELVDSVMDYAEYWSHTTAQTYQPHDVHQGRLRRIRGNDGNCLMVSFFIFLSVLITTYTWLTLVVATHAADWLFQGLRGPALLGDQAAHGTRAAGNAR